VFKEQEKFIYHRSATIPKIFLHYEVSIYTGKKMNETKYKQMNGWF